MLDQPECHKRKCVHFLGCKDLVEGEEITEIAICKAFPNGIPDDIAYGENKHSKVVKGQVGNYVYERERRSR